MCKVFSNSFKLLIIILFLSSCGNNGLQSDQSVNHASVSYGGNFHAVQNITENFEQGRKPSYATATTAFKTGKWILTDALTGGTEADAKNGKQSIRIKNNGKISMLFDLDGTATVSVKHAVYGEDGPSSWALFVSVDGGKIYSQTGSAVISKSHVLQNASFIIQKSGKLRFEIRKLSGGKNRINIDDFTITGTQDIKNEAGTSVSTGDTIVYSNPVDTVSASDNDNSNLLLGNPSGATADPANYNNYLINQQYYTESYSRDRGGPNWVCWHLGSSDLGNTKRLNNFRADTRLPHGWYEVQNYSYNGYGFDKGHNCPSGDRTNSTDANSATFLMDNMVPQAPNNNQRTWEHLESFCRNQISTGNEVYVMMGSYGKGGTGSQGYTETIDSGRVTVPARIWKVLIVIPNGDHDLKRINGGTTIIAVDTPNDNSINPNWMEYTCTVRDIEKNTGYNLLSSLPKALQDSLENFHYKGTMKQIR